MERTSRPHRIDVKIMDDLLNVLDQSLPPRIGPVEDVEDFGSPLRLLSNFLGISGVHGSRNIG